MFEGGRSCHQTSDQQARTDPPWLMISSIPRLSLAYCTCIAVVVVLRIRPRGKDERW